jgi:stalled ribosome rescue protein Dom34
MNKKTGLWIDKKKAVVVRIDGENIEKIMIESNTDRQESRYDGIKSNAKFEQKPTRTQDIQDRAYMTHLDKYYDEIISKISGASSIYIFGPGEAKIELNKKMSERKLDGNIASVETADKMTDPQIISKTRKFFEPKG